MTHISYKLRLQRICLLRLAQSITQLLHHLVLQSYIVSHTHQQFLPFESERKFYGLQMSMCTPVGRSNNFMNQHRVTLFTGSSRYIILPVFVSLFFRKNIVISLAYQQFFGHITHLLKLLIDNIKTIIILYILNKNSGW